MRRRVSLRLRLTVGMGIVLFIISIFLTVSSFELANRHFVSPIDHAVQQAQITYPAESLSQYDIIDSTPLTPLESVDTVLTSEISSLLLLGREQFYSTALLYMLLITFIGCLVMYYVLGKILNPLQKLTYQMGEINEHELSQRVKLSESSDEIFQLAQSFNLMMDRIDKAFNSQKRFSSDAAHELKTPLTVLRTNLEVLQFDDSPKIEDYKEVIEVVEKQTNRMIDLVEHLFLVSSKQDYELTDDIDYGVMFKQIIDDLMMKSTDMKVSISAEIEPVRIRGNKLMLTQAFSNLVENAIKYNKVGGSIQISLKRRKKYDLIKIEDSGIGLSEDQLKQIFEPFYRADQSRSRKVGGAGLGLAITKDIIQRHQGHIKVTSMPNCGTTFEVRLPRVE